MGLIGLNTSSTFGAHWTPTSPQVLMNGAGGGLYTAQTGDQVTSVGVRTSASGTFTIEVGVYRLDTLQLVGSAQISGSSNAGYYAVPVSFPLIAGVQYAVGCRTVSGNVYPWAWNAAAYAYNVLTGSSSLESPFVVAGSSNQLYSIYATVINTIAATPTADSTGAGALTTGIKLGAAASAITTASGVMGSYIYAAAQSASSAGAALSTAIKMAAGAVDPTSVSGELTVWSTVTLTGSLYAGSGSILDPNAPWSNGAPGAGDTVYYDATYLTINTDGEIVATTNDPNGNGLGFSALCQWDNGGTWSFLVIVVTPWTTGQAVSTTAAVGALTAGIQLSASAQATFNAAAALATSGGGTIGGAAADSSGASGRLATEIQLASAAQIVSTGVASLATAIEAAANAIDDFIGGGMLSNEALTAAATDDSSASAVLNTQIEMLGAVVTLTSAIGALSAAIRFASNAVDATSAAGALSTRIQADAHAASDAQLQATLATGVNLRAVAAAASSATAAIITAIRAAASLSASSSLAGALSTLIRLAGSGASSSSAVAALKTVIALVGDVHAQTIASAYLSTKPGVLLAGDVRDTSIAMGDLATRLPVSAAAADGSAAAGSLSTGIRIAGDASDDAAGAADLFTSIDPDATATVESTVRGALGGAGSTLFTADVVVQALPGWMATSYCVDPMGRFPQRIGDRLVYAIDWTGWLGAYWRPGVEAAIGDVVRPWPPNGFQYRCLSGGATGGAPPEWPPYLGAAVLDGAAEWQAAPLDSTSLTATLKSATWTAPLGIVITNAHISGLLALVTIDTSQCGPYTNYDVLCQAVASDGRQRVGKLCIQVAGVTAN